MPQADFEIQSLLLDPASNEGEAAQILACGETPVKLEKEILKSPAKAYHYSFLGPPRARRRRRLPPAGGSPRAEGKEFPEFYRKFRISMCADLGGRSPRRTPAPCSGRR